MLLEYNRYFDKRVYEAVTWGILGRQGTNAGAG
jgi:hypothetical protein